MIDKQIEMHELAKQMSEAISTAVEQRYIEDEAKLEAVLRANGWRKVTDVAREIFEEVMQALEKGVAEANKTILDKTRIFTEELICTGEMYAGHIGKSICEVFKKYESEEK